MSEFRGASPGLGASPEDARRFARLLPVRTVRRVAVGRLVAILAGLVGVAALVVSGGTRALQAAMTWLHHQPAYLLAFRDIEVRSPGGGPLPTWLRTGRVGLLERARLGGAYPETISVPDLDLERFATTMTRESPWARAVERVQRVGRNRVVVEVEVREPVAVIQLGDARNSMLIALDRDGVVLPDEDLDREAAGPLILLAGMAPRTLPDGVKESRPGRRLQLADNVGGAPAEVLLEATRLAGFFREVGAHRGRPQAPCQITVIQEDARGALWAQTADRAMLLWRPAASGAADLASNREKWEVLVAWLENHRTGDYPSPGHFITIGRDGVRARSARDRSH